MATRRLKSFAVVVIAAVSMQGASAYMEYPPTTMAKLCKSPRIRLLKVAKFDKEKGVVIFEVAVHGGTMSDFRRTFAPVHRAVVAGERLSYSSPRHDGSAPATGTR